MVPDYSEPLIILREWTRRYGEAMREGDWHDARQAALEAAKYALRCVESAKLAEAATAAHLPAYPFSSESAEGGEHA